MIWVKGQLLDAIEPDDAQGETPLLPLLNRFKPIGTTADVDFTTTRHVHSTVRSHVDAVVLDSAWEQSAAFFLEQQKDFVKHYVRNDRPFLLIPYEYEGVARTYEPDYIVCLNDGTFLLLEIKGQHGDEESAKHQAARRWCSAVNNWGNLGRWDFMECRNPQELTKKLKWYLVQQSTALRCV